MFFALKYDFCLWIKVNYKKIENYVILECLYYFVNIITMSATSRAVLFAEFGVPQNSMRLGLDLRDSYSRKDWQNHKPKSSANPYIITYIGHSGQYHVYDKGGVAYNTVGGLAWFSSVMTSRTERERVSLQNVVAIRIVNNDFTTRVVYERP